MPAYTYHMQVEPLVRLWTAREGVEIRVVGDDRCGLLVVERDDGVERWARLQRPWGPPREARALLVSEFRRLRAAGYGLLVAALPEAAFAAFEAEALVRAAAPQAEEVWRLDLAAWDPNLRGNRYKTLRQAVARAERSGIRIESYDPSAHAAAVALLEAWTATRPRGDVSWIRRLIEAPPPGTLAAMARGPDGRPVEWAAVWREVPYAYALAAVAPLDSSRSTEALDVALLRALRAEGATFVDWGVRNPGTPGVDAYKRKFGKPISETVVTAWYPAV